jgi:hypothetical protein
VNDYEQVAFATREEFPDFKVVFKNNSGLMKTIGFLLKPICPTFMTGFITTIGTTMYVPEAWATYRVTSKAEILRHERVHMRQAKKYGMLWFSILYLFVPLPLFFANYRAMFEREAYEESLRACVEYYGKSSILYSETKREYVAYFTGSNYGWMWPNKSAVEKWYSDTVDRIYEESSK